MNDLVQKPDIEGSDTVAILTAAIIEDHVMGPSVDIEMTHTFHAGMYARTAKIPAGTMITGALIHIATLLIVSGECLMFSGAATIPLKGYRVLRAAANRKQAFYAVTETHMTMLFPTSATTVEEAEAEFTAEAELLLSRAQDGATIDAGD